MCVLSQLLKGDVTEASLMYCGREMYGQSCLTLSTNLIFVHDCNWLVV